MANEFFKLADALEEGFDNAGNISSAAGAIKDIVESAAAEQIESGGTRGGKPYERLAPSTIRQRQRQGFAPGPPLIKSGRLKESVSKDLGAEVSDGGATIDITDNADEKIERITGYIDQGTGRMPARDIFELTEADMQEIDEEIADSVEQKILASIDKR